MHFVYILHSIKIDKFYIGESAFPDERLIEHNSGKYLNAFTKIASDWLIFLTIECDSRKQALSIEKKIKSMKSKKYIIKLKELPELIVALKKV